MFFKKHINYISISDPDLVKLLQQSDEGAFHEIYMRYWNSCFLYAFSRLRDRPLAEDICHEIFLSMWKRREALVIETLEAWLIQAVKYCIIKQLKKSLVISISNDLVIADNQTENSIINKNLSQTCLNLANKLEGKSKTVFQLSKVQHLSNKEIAQKMNLSEKTVEYYITKALKILRLRLRSDI